MRGARLFPPKWRGGKKKENIVENHLQFRHVQLADNREGWGGEAIHLSRHQMLPVNLF